MHATFARISQPLRVLLVGAALALTPLAVRAQTWTGFLASRDAVPANDSPATGSITLTLSGTELIVQTSWSDLVHYPESVRLLTAKPQTAFSRDGLVMYLPFVQRQSGTSTERINLTERPRYYVAFLRAHADRADSARAALIAALDSGYVAVMSQRESAIEIGAHLTRVKDGDAADARPASASAPSSPTP